jgi:hypothetical protein
MSAKGTQTGRFRRTSLVARSALVLERPTRARPKWVVNAPCICGRFIRPRLEPLNPTPRVVSARQSGRTYNVEPVAGLLAKNDIAQRTPLITNDQRIGRTYNLQRTRDILARREMTQSELATPNVQAGGRNLQPTPDNLAPRETLQSESRHDWHGKKHRLGYSDALRCHPHEWHDRNWWK